MKVILFLSFMLAYGKIYAEVDIVFDKVKIKEIASNIFQSFQLNKTITFDERVDDKQFEFALNLNLLRSKYHKMIQDEVKLEIFDEVSICDEILIFKSLLLNPKKSLGLILVFYKLNNEFKLYKVKGMHSDLNDFAKSSNICYRIDKDFVELEILKNNLPKLPDEIASKIFSIEPGDKISNEDLIAISNKVENEKIYVKFIGGINTSKNYGVSYYLFRSNAQIVILSLSFATINGEIKILSSSRFNDAKWLGEGFFSFSEKK